jgi:hypothetical protein
MNYYAGTVQGLYREKRPITVSKETCGQGLYRDYRQSVH